MALVLVQVIAVVVVTVEAVVVTEGREEIMAIVQP
jgi:hypothetical protein